MNYYFLSRTIYQKILCMAMEGAPLEICGLVSRAPSGASRLFPVENELHSPTRFRMAPQQLLDALMSIEENGETLYAIYHSHPNGPATPSETDRLEDAYPEVVKLIAACLDGLWTLNAYRIDGEGYHALRLALA